MPLQDDTKAKIIKLYGKLPITFVPNKEQIDLKVKYYTKGNGFQCLFTQEEVLYTFYEFSAASEVKPSLLPSQRLIPNKAEEKIKGVTLAFRFIEANPQVLIEARSEGDGKVNYIKGNDPEKWVTELLMYREVIYRDLWPGVDLIFRGPDGRLKYDLVIKPGTDLERIQFTYVGGNKMELDEEGNLNIHTPIGIFQDKKPTSFQEIDGQQIPIESQFLLKKEGNSPFVCRLEVGKEYDPRFPLVIDPGILLYSTYLGGPGSDSAFGIDVDAAGNAYVTGQTTSMNFPITPGAFDTTFSGSVDAFVTKLNTTGSALVYSTFLGGAGGGTISNGIDVDFSGSAYITGRTTSPNFPVTANAFDTTFNGTQDAFITKLNSSGNALVYSTFLGGGGGTAVGNDIAVDFSGNAYVTGDTTSPNFPVTAGAFDTSINGTDDAFITKLNSSGSDLVYSTFLGGAGGFSVGTSIAVDNLGNAYVTGQTTSMNFPITPGAFDTTFNGGIFDAFVTKLNAMGSALVYSTFLGGTGSDLASGIAVDLLGNAYVIGSTDSTDFPTTPFAFDTLFNGGNDVFITKLNPTGNALLYSTFLGGDNSDAGSDIVVDNSGNAYVTGRTTSPNFPVTANAFDITQNGPLDAFIAKINTNAPSPNSSLVSSTYVGGDPFASGDAIAIDSIGATAYVAGQTFSAAFPTTVGAFDRTFNGGSFDAFVLRIQF